MIGKISFVGWADAPKDATHVAISKSTNQVLWVKFKQPYWHCWYTGTTSSNWIASLVTSSTKEWVIISKEEDLGMTKQVKSIEDLEVGMFVKWSSSNYPYVVDKNKNIVSIENGKRFLWNQNGWDSPTNFPTIFWSYTYNGEYKPVLVSETPEQLKIKELEETIANASKQLQELKGMQK